MADFPLPDDTAQRYAELEKAYVEEHWSTVLTNGQTLLEAIETSDDPQAEGLANRVRVLLGHTHLYGLAEPEVAEDYYRSVLGSRAEPELRRIAAEGLQQCLRPRTLREQPAQAGDAGMVSDAPIAPPAGAPINASADPFLAAVLASGAATTAAPGTATAPATPWLADVPQDLVAPAPAGALELIPSLEVEVVEEPELVEVAQADPNLAEELELELSRIRERRAAAAAAAAAKPAGQEDLEQEDLEEDAASIEALEELSAPPTDISAGEQGDRFAAAISAALEGVEAPAAQATPRRATAPAPDLSGEDPELVASLLRVVIRR
jgi:hypothetical protein